MWKAIKGDDIGDVDGTDGLLLMLLDRGLIEKIRLLDRSGYKMWKKGGRGGGAGGKVKKLIVTRLGDQEGARGNRSNRYAMVTGGGYDSWSRFSSIQVPFHLAGCCCRESTQRK